MIKSEYFAKLIRALQWGMLRHDLCETMDDFEEIFKNGAEAGKSEAEIIVSMGTVEKVRKNLISEEEKRREKIKITAFILLLVVLLIPAVHTFVSGSAYMLFFEGLLVLWVLSGDMYRNYGAFSGDGNRLRQILWHQAGACLTYVAAMSFIYRGIPYMIGQFVNRGEPEKAGPAAVWLLGVLLLAGIVFCLISYYLLWRYCKPLYGCFILYFSITLEVAGYYFHLRNSTGMDALLNYRPLYWVCTLAAVLLYYLYCYFINFHIRG